MRMLMAIVPKLPMRDKVVTRNFYTSLGFQVIGSSDYQSYLMVQMENIEIHFFDHRNLDPKDNYGQVYIRTNDIDGLYAEMLDKKLPIHPAGRLAIKPWGQREFSMLDPDSNLLTFGQASD